LRQSTATLFPTTLRSKPPPGHDARAAAADLWRDASLAMAAIARQRGVLFLHVLQPNQWWRGAGAYRPIAEDHSYGWVVEPVNQGYDELIARAPALQAAGVEMLDATRLFANRDPRDVYADDCCRYTGDGHDVLATAIAERIDAIQTAPRVPVTPR